MPVFESFMTGINAGNQQADRRTRMMTGQRAAAGDFAGASQAAYQGGDLATGGALAQQGRQQQIAPLLRDGQYDQAMRIPGVTPEEMQGIAQFRASRSKEELDLAAAKFEALAGVVSGLGQLPVDQRLGEAQRLAPMFGMDPSQITPEMLTDDGLRRLARAETVAKSAEAEMLSPLTAAEQERLRTYLTKMAGHSCAPGDACGGPKRRG